ncbi:MAG: hypothetical protein HY361_03245 [Candidatus Aenigmarchaeota archaeon]|nr:hypothetical protein [Candidatus Aenigmarchaeota archaeon]
MELQDIDMEIEKLKFRKIELTNKLNIAYDFEEKEDIRLDIQRLQQQIDTLLKFKKKL